jgi:hypothetical protein
VIRLLRRFTVRWRITIGTLLIAIALSAVAVVAFRAQIENILAPATGRGALCRGADIESGPHLRQAGSR